MRRSVSFIVTAVVALLVAVGLLADDVAAQQKTLKEQLIGTWTFISSCWGLGLWRFRPHGP